MWCTCCATTWTQADDRETGASEKTHICERIGQVSSPHFSWQIFCISILTRRDDMQASRSKPRLASPWSWR
jgi:hypothetical protein